MEIDQELITKFSKYCQDIGWKFNEYSSEFTFQFRLGWFLNTIYNNDYLVDFERNIKEFIPIKVTEKKEVDLIITKKTSDFKCAIELKFIKNQPAYDLGLYKVCEDILFLEQLKSSGFSKAFAIVFSIIPDSYTAPKNGKYKAKTKERLEFYKMFREDKMIKKGKIFGNKDANIEIENDYKLDWFDFTNQIKICIVKV